MAKNVAIVTPWHGPESTGGAESLAGELAARLARIDNVTLVTTTARSFLHRWDQNYFPAGRTGEAFEIRRFKVDARDAASFDALNERLLHLPPNRWAELEYADATTDAFIEQSINSTDLEAHLRSAGYDVAIFLPYLYGVVVRGIEAFPGPSFLLPCLHDESYARIPRIRRAVHRAAGLLFNSDGEAELALRLFGPGILHKSTVVGSGIEFDDVPATSTLRMPLDPFVLYLGRRDPTKNVDLLVDAFAAYRARRNGRSGRPLSLVLAGPGGTDYGDPGAGIVDLGFVDDAAKHELLRAARSLVQPSQNESYSRVLMEAWMRGTPCAVNGDCLATSTAVRAAAGGWTVDGSAAWTAFFETVEALPDDERVALAARGRTYAETRANWDIVVAAVRGAAGIVERAAPARRGRIDQVVQTLEFGDAISEEAMFWRDRLGELGFESTIFATSIGDRVHAEAKPLMRRSLHGADAIVYHHSIRSEATAAVLAAAVPKALVYHNITPAAFFAAYDPAFAALLVDGRSQLAPLLPAFDVLVADSTFNAGELLALGGAQPPITIPPIVAFARFDVAPDRATLARARRGARWLFVGRVAPNKGITALVDAFEVYLTIDPQATLDVVGRYDPRDAYFRHVRSVVDERGLDGAVRFHGMVENEVLHAHYRSADVFVTLSEHEGFCVPVVEAMMFDLPIVARATTAIPETLGAGGLMVSADADAYDVAVLVATLVTDAQLRNDVVRAQRARRVAYFPQSVTPRVDSLAARLLA